MAGFLYENQAFPISPVLKTLPKVELHCHLDGSLSQSLIESILGRKVEPSRLRVDEECTSLAEYLERFAIPLQCLKTQKGLMQGAYNFMESLSKDRIVYAEVRFAPLLSVNENMNVRNVIEAVLAGLSKGREEYGIEFGVLVCAMRHMEESENLAMFKAAREYLNYGVCGADLAGDEAAYPMKQFINLFKEVKNLGMPFTIHAGECQSVTNIEEAIGCGAGRIGHGIAMKGHSGVMKLCRDKRIGIEMCPISNMQTKAVENPAVYPIKEFLEYGLLVSVNTDNRTVSDTTVEKEIGFIQKNYGISATDVVRMMKNAVETAFAPDDLKHKLLKKLSDRRP